MSAVDLSSSGRADFLFRQHRESIYRRTDHWFAWLLLCQWLAAIAAAMWISPRTWAGSTSQTHIHVWGALILGSAIISLPIMLAWLRPSWALTRHVIAVAQMLMGAM